MIIKFGTHETTLWFQIWLVKYLQQQLKAHLEEGETKESNSEH